MVALVAIIMIGIMMYVLIKSKLSPVVAFVVLPLLAASILIFLVGFHGPKGQVLTISQQFAQLFYTWTANGVKSTMSNATLFIFSIVYFGLMSDAGMFDPIVRGLTKIAGKSPVMIYITTALIALVSQADGATATTYLITIPAMLPLFKKLKLNVLSLLCILGIVCGNWNMVPWGGTIIRTATTVSNLGVPATPQGLWIKILPVEILGMVLALALAVFFGLKDKRRLLKEYGSDYFEKSVDTEITIDEEVNSLKRPKLIGVNLLLTVTVIVSMIITKIPAYLAFMLGTALALAINYKGLKAQDIRVQDHAANAIGTAATFLAAGVFLGVFQASGMTLAMANLLISALPEFLLIHTGRIIGFFGPLIGLVFSPDIYYYSLLPVVGEVVKSVGGNPEQVGLAMLVGENIGIPISPCVPTTFLAIGLAGVELKDHIMYSIKYMIPVSIIMILVGIMMGVM